MTKTKVKREKSPTVDTCVISQKPIRQKDIDNKKVISYGKGKAFVTAVQKSIASAPSNPIVLSAKELNTVTLDYEAWNFPKRVKIAGKIFASLPPRIYLQNAAFKLTNEVNFLYVNSDHVEETEDKLLESGKVTYTKIPDHHKIAQNPLDIEKKA